MKKKGAGRRKIILLTSIIVLLVVVAASAVVLRGKKAKNVASSNDTVAVNSKPKSPLATSQSRAQLIGQANTLAASYDYDGAIDFLKQYKNYEKHQDIQAAIAGYENTRATLVEVDITDIPHFFTHPLIYDAKEAFASDMKTGYQQESLTVDEFNNFLQQMYDNNYVLVSIHDVAPSYKGKDGKRKVRPGKIYLPKGKKAFMFSEDDTNYYQRWQQKGVGSRLVVGEDGKPTCEVDLKDGSKIRGDYDVIPCLDRFIEKHPDFSYRGAKAMIGVTGIEGVFGYRTSKYVLGEYNDPKVNSQDDFNPDSKDAKAVTAVAQAIRDDGYILSSHSFVHGAFYSNGEYCSQQYLKYDISRFKNEIASLIGKVDVILYPNGADIEHGEDGWKYKMSNPRFKRLYNSGLLYYFNVDTSEESPWGRIGKNYYRGRRVGLIGYTVLCKKDYMKRNFGLSTKTMVDKNRPLPKTLNYYGTKVKVDCK